MQHRVTAILLAHSGAEYLEVTLAALQGQTVAPDFVVGVDLSSTDRSEELLGGAPGISIVTVPNKSTFGQAVSQALIEAPSQAADAEWLWLLGHDNAPRPDALERLLDAVAHTPSVSIAGPKLMRWDAPDTIAEFGESLTRLGSSIRLVEGELDQAQHDAQEDVLGVAAGGMLVRRSVWVSLGGFDPALPSVDASLDFCVRARLSGHGVIVVPDARVASRGGPELFDREKVGPARRATLSRSAQLHRRLVYASSVALPFHLLSLIPLALFRSILHLLAKHPGAVAGELGTALRATFHPARVFRARHAIRRSGATDWGSVRALRLTPRQAREQRIRQSEVGETSDIVVAAHRERVGFITGGGLWTMLAMVIVGLVAFGRFLGSTSLVGGALLPLSSQVTELWENVGYGRREIGVGFTGAADPFAWVLAVLGSATFWNPSTSIIVLYLAALPLASIGAWFAARRFTVKPFLPALAATLWPLSPPFLNALDSGRIAPAIVHIVLPWLVLLTVRGARSWSSAAGAALLFAVATASAPSIAPALLLLWLAWFVTHPRGAHRLVIVPIPAIVLFLPLVFDQAARGTLIGLFADPGVPVDGGTASGLQLAIGSASGASNGWSELLVRIVLPGGAGPFVVAFLLLPLGVLAVISLFTRGSRRAIPPLVIALFGYATAVAASRIDVVAAGAETVGIWPGAGLSLFWLGLTGGAMLGIDILDRATSGTAILTGVTASIVAIPLVAASVLGTLVPQASIGRTLPAYVDAEAAGRPGVGTLIITPVADGTVATTLERGRGATLDDQSTLAKTATVLGPQDARLAVLAGNLVSVSGYDFVGELDSLGVAFVVLDTSVADQVLNPELPIDPATAESPEVIEGKIAIMERARGALDGNSLLAPVGETSSGLLWRYNGQVDESVPSGRANASTPWGVIVLLVQGGVLLLTALIAIPTIRRRHRAATATSALSAPATTFDEDTDD